MKEGCSLNPLSVAGKSIGEIESSAGLVTPLYVFSGRLFTSETRAASLHQLPRSLRNGRGVTVNQKELVIHRRKTTETDLTTGKHVGS